MTYKIIYIDEQTDDAESFINYVEKNDASKEFEVEHMLPAESLEELIDEIIKSSPHAIVSDFMLNEYKSTEVQYTVPYTGVDVVNSFMELRKLFPCFVLTSFAPDAAHDSSDVNMIYAKSVFTIKETDGLNFLDRVKVQIINYAAKISESEQRLNELLTKLHSEGLDAPEESELYKLDTFLENVVDSKSSIPVQLKDLSKLNQLDVIIEKVDLLLKEVNDEKGV